MHYNSRVAFLLLLVQAGQDVWRRKMRGGRLLGHPETGEWEIFTFWRVRTGWEPLLCLAAEDGDQAECVVLTPALRQSSKAKKKCVNELYKLELLGCKYPCWREKKRNREGIQEHK